MAILDLLSSALSMYCLRTPFLRPGTEPRSGQRQDMIFPPLLNAIIFVAAASLGMAGLPAHWLLLAIVPVMAFFGTRSSRS